MLGEGRGRRQVRGIAVGEIAAPPGSREGPGAGGGPEVRSRGRAPPGGERRYIHKPRVLQVLLMCIRFGGKLAHISR